MSSAGIDSVCEAALKARITEPVETSFYGVLVHRLALLASNLGHGFQENVMWMRNATS